MNVKKTPPERKGKSAAIVGYLTIFGSIIAIFMNMEDQNKFASFHIRQALGIHLMLILFGVLVNGFGAYFSDFVNLMIGAAFYLSYFILWIYGFIGAVMEKYNEIPLIGPFSQKFFKKII